MFEFKLIDTKVKTREVEYLFGAPIELKPNEEHLVLRENFNAIVTDKSNGLWISKSRFLID